MDSPYALVGPMLPQALRLAKYQAATSLPGNVDVILNENDVVNRPPSPEEERLLASNAAVVIALENLFSWYHKDRSSRTSKLSRVESVRFQRAVYRIWLVSVLFGPDLDKNEEDQKSFLEPFSSDELLQIEQSTQFLLLVRNMVLNAEERRIGRISNQLLDDMFLSAGPHKILRCHEDETIFKCFPVEQVDSNDIDRGFLVGALCEIFKARKLEVHGEFVGTILDGINGEHDLCYHCSFADRDPHKRFLSELFNETNWECLKGYPVNQIVALPGYLSDNLTEKTLREVLAGDWSRLLHEIFPHRSKKYSKWSKQDWICCDCWADFMWDTVWRWRLQKKRLAGKTIMENCEYGYDCKKQRHKSGLAHAEKYNHLCEPSSDQYSIEDIDSDSSMTMDSADDC